MSKYNNSKIYKIIDNTNGNIYIGSTFQKYLSTRLAGHVSNYKQYVKDKYRYTKSFDIIKNGDYDIVLIENVNCETKEQLHAKERYYIETMNCINKVIPGRTTKEYSDYYYEKNRNILLLKSKRDAPVYYEKNKDIILSKNKEYRDTHKDEISERRKKKFTCICGSEYRICDQARHERSIKHQTYFL
jgi:hypothetical protein